MGSARNSNYDKLEKKVAAIRAGDSTVKNSFNAGEAIIFACRYHKNGAAYEPIKLIDLSKVRNANLPGYLSNAIEKIKGLTTKLPMPCAVFMANMTGKDLEFWQQEHYSLTELESIQITLPGEVKPGPTISVPASGEQGLTSSGIPTARDLAKAVLFPPDLKSTNIAQRMAMIKR